MSRTILVEEFHLTVRAPRGLPEGEYDAIRRALNDARFKADLRRSVRAVFRTLDALGKVKLKLSR